MATKQMKLFSIRVDADVVGQLERLGAEAKPVPASRNEMIGVAIAQYVERNQPLVKSADQLKRRLGKSFPGTAISVSGSDAFRIEVSRSAESEDAWLQVVVRLAEELRGLHLTLKPYHPGADRVTIETK